MARKRQIDPDIWTSEQFIGLSRDARLLFIGMISQSDDEGRMKGSCIHLKLIIFPADNLDISDINTWRNEIVTQKLAVLYAVDGQEYVYLPKYFKHQYMSKRFPSKLPSAPKMINRVMLEINNQSRAHIYKRDNYTCQYCGTVYDEGNRALSVDHVVPISKGGITEYDNLVASCKSCASRKRERTLDEAGMALIEMVTVNDEEDNTDERFKELLKLAGWGKNDKEKDLSWLAEFVLEYPTFNPTYIHACRDYHSNKKGHTKAQWKSRLRNYMRINKEKQEAHDGNGNRKGVQGSVRPSSAGYEY